MPHSVSSDFAALLYDVPEPGIARITLNKPNVANAQDTNLLYELNTAFDRAAHDDDIRVIILAANGKHFSAGHDLSEKDGHDTLREHDTVAPVCGFGCAGAEAQMAREEGNLSGFLRPLAEHPEADHRGGAGQMHRRRADAGVALRHHHRRR